MMPVVTLVGRPNVGKSTLFNCLTRSRAALVADVPGVTRDRHYGAAQWEGQNFIVIDTGGIGHDADTMQALIQAQVEQALREADVVVLVLDARHGLLPGDALLAQQLRQLNKSVVIAVNKIDGLDPAVALADFFRLGKHPLAISAAQRSGIAELVQCVVRHFPATEVTGEEVGDNAVSPAPDAIKIAIIGRPNVGKSTLINRMLGEARVIVADQAGTTRDSLYLPLQRFKQSYILIDTAGVRRKSQITDRVEKLSVVKTLQAIEEAQVVIFVLDARAQVAEQDLHLLGFIIEAGKALVIAVNKWDNLPVSQREMIKAQIDRRLAFVDFARLRYISALHGTGVGELFDEVQQAYAAAAKKLATPRLNQILQQALIAHQPPIHHGHRIKLRYAHSGGNFPPCIIIHGNQAAALPPMYQRYLIHTFRKALHLAGTPIRLLLRDSENPYRDKPNRLSERQQRKRQRVIAHRRKEGK